MSILKDGGAGVDVFNNDTDHTPDSGPRDGPRDPNLRSLLERIDALTAREDLERVSEAVTDRRRELRDRAIRQMRRELESGDTVRFIAPISPRYMEGLTATVVEVNRTRAVLQIPAGDPRYGKFARGSGRMQATLSIIERVDSLDEATDADADATQFGRG